MAKIKEILPEGFKRCSKCGEVKRIEEFGKYTKNKDGIRESCKLCNKKIYIEHYNKNRIKIIYMRRINYIKNRDKIINRQKEWYSINRNVINQKQQKTNKEYSKRWNIDNNDKIRLYSKVYLSKSIKTLSDSYIKKELKNGGFPMKYITPELIETKRLIMKSKRLTNKLKN